jgi:hypothetical protein
MAVQRPITGSNMVIAGPSLSRVPTTTMLRQKSGYVPSARQASLHSATLCSHSTAIHSTTQLPNVSAVGWSLIPSIRYLEADSASCAHVTDNVWLPRPFPSGYFHIHTVNTLKPPDGFLVCVVFPRLNIVVHVSGH